MQPPNLTIIQLVTPTLSPTLTLPSHSTGQAELLFSVASSCVATLTVTALNWDAAWAADFSCRSAFTIGSIALSGGGVDGWEEEESVVEGEEMVDFQRLPVRQANLSNVPDSAVEGWRASSEQEGLDYNSHVNDLSSQSIKRCHRQGFLSDTMAGLKHMAEVSQASEFPCHGRREATPFDPHHPK